MPPGAAVSRTWNTPAALFDGVCSLSAVTVVREPHHWALESESSVDASAEIAVRSCTGDGVPSARHAPRRRTGLQRTECSRSERKKSRCSCSATRSAGLASVRKSRAARV